MIRVKILDNEGLEGIMNDLLNSTEELTDLQLQLREEEDYMKLTAVADSIKETLAGCPEADLMEEFEDAVYWRGAYEMKVAYLEGIKKGFNLRRFLTGELEQRQQDSQVELQETATP